MVSSLWLDTIFVNVRVNKRKICFLVFLCLLLSMVFVEEKDFEHVYGLFFYINRFFIASWWS